MKTSSFFLITLTSLETETRSNSSTSGKGRERILGWIVWKVGTKGIKIPAIVYKNENLLAYSVQQWNNQVSGIHVATAIE